MIAMLFLEVEPELEATPFVEDTVIEPRQQAKQPPFDHVDKNPIPSLSRLCMNRMITLCRFYRIVEPISFSWPISCHSSKQTTILADIGVDCDHVAPANVTAYMHV